MWPNDISSAADNAIFKIRAQNIDYSFNCVIRSAVLLKPNVANILLFNFCKQKLIQYFPITIAIDCNGLSLLIFEEKWLNYASGPKSPPNSDSFWVRWLFNLCVRVFCTPNTTILLVYIFAKIKMSFIWKYDLFAKVGIFCKSIAGLLSEAKMNRMVNWVQLLNQLKFVWRYNNVFMENSSQWCLRNFQL